MHDIQFKLTLLQGTKPIAPNYTAVTAVLHITTKRESVVTPLFQNQTQLTETDYTNCQRSFVPIWNSLNIVSANAIRSALTNLMENLTYSLNDNLTIGNLLYHLLQAGTREGADRLPPFEGTGPMVTYMGSGIHQGAYWAKATTSRNKTDVINFLKELRNPTVIVLESHVNHYHGADNHKCDVEVSFAIKSDEADAFFEGNPSQLDPDVYTHRGLAVWLSFFALKSPKVIEMFKETPTLLPKTFPVEISYQTFSTSLRTNLITGLKLAFTYFQETIYSLKTPLVQTLKEKLRVSNLLPLRKSN